MNHISYHYIFVLFYFFLPHYISAQEYKQISPPNSDIKEALQLYHTQSIQGFMVQDSIATNSWYVTDKKRSYAFTLFGAFGGFITGIGLLEGAIIPGDVEHNRKVTVISLTIFGGLAGFFLDSMIYNF